MSGIGLTLQKGDSFKTLLDRTTLAFVFHFASKQRQQLVTNSNQIPATILIIGAIAFLYFAENALAKDETPGFVRLKQLSLLVLTTIQSYLAILLVGVTDVLFSNSLGSEKFSFLNLYRPASFLALAMGLSVLIQIFYDKGDKPESTAQRINKLEQELADLTEKINKK